MGSQDLRLPSRRGFGKGVLSPILYFAFANMFLRESPAMAGPLGVDASMPEFFGQGAQSCSQANWLPGVVNSGPGGRCGLPVAGQDDRRRLMAPLFMDDTTLLTQTKGDLRLPIEAYQRFCGAFRMRLNPAKYKLTRFLPAGFQAGRGHDEMTLCVGGVTFNTPDRKVGQDWCQHRYLSYLTDSCLIGKGQVARACAIALGRTGAVEVVANRMGEAYAMRYVEAVVAPSALYAAEMAPVFRTAASLAAKKLGRVHTTLLAEAAGLGRLGGNRGRLGITGVPLPALRREGLISETR